MKTLTRIRITSLATLALIGATAQGEVLCNRCEIIDVDQWTGTYVGSFWSHDRATFVNPTMVNYYGFFSWWGNNVVFDLNETAVVTFTATPKRGTAFRGFDASGAAWAMDLYPDAGTVCNADGQCSVRSAGGGYLIAGATTFDGSESITFTVESLPPGRYVLFFQGYTNTAGENSYSGKITVKRPRLGIGP